MTTIDELIRRLEAATGPDRGLDGAIAVASGQYDEHFQGRDGSRANEGWVSRNDGARVPAPRYTGSIDAALTLVPDNFWMDIKTAGTSSPNLREYPVVEFGGGLWPQSCREHIVQAKTIPISICIASLRARAATERTEA